MKKLLLFVTLYFLTINAYGKCVKDSVVRSDIIDCAKEELDQATSTLRRSIAQSKTKNIVEAQKYWKEYRDSQCKLEDMLTYPGREASIDELGCQARITTQRKTIIDYLEKKTPSCKNYEKFYSLLNYRFEKELNSNNSNTNELEKKTNIKFNEYLLKQCKHKECKAALLYYHYGSGFLGCLPPEIYNNDELLFIYNEKDIPLLILLSMQKNRIEDIDYINNLAYYLQKLNENNRAKELLEAILIKAPERTVAYLNLGDSLNALGDTQAAIKNYKIYVEQMTANGKAEKIPMRVHKYLLEGASSTRTINEDIHLNKKNVMPDKQNELTESIAQENKKLFGSSSFGFIGILLIALIIRRKQTLPH